MKYGDPVFWLLGWVCENHDEWMAMPEAQRAVRLDDFLEAFNYKPRYYRLLFNKDLTERDVRNRLYDVQRGRCAGCGCWSHDYRAMELDHVVALASGGADGIGNFQLLCARCNRVKGCGKTQWQLWRSNASEGFMYNHAAAVRAHARAIEWQS